MTTTMDQILKLDVPVIVRVGERHMTVGEVLRLAPGAIIELPKVADSDLDLLINNREVGIGSAVKVGENFGLRLTFVGSRAQRLKASAGEGEASMSEAEAEKLAQVLLAGQL